MDSADVGRALDASLRLLAGPAEAAWDPHTGVVSRRPPVGGDEDPGLTLLWATGRIALPGYPRRESWTLRAALEA
ncbi:hypothetical protein ABT297_14575 [Dactylosporangium sp. NPDC000555]|uniref:hypothetical protein n=1 Tax=Dactylosporangium sp. NPDC000555 TaxID=3154260 RepID=UPI003331854C